MNRREGGEGREKSGRGERGKEWEGVRRGDERRERERERVIYNTQGQEVTGGGHGSPCWKYGAVQKGGADNLLELNRGCPPGS